MSCEPEVLLPAPGSIRDRRNRRSMVIALLAVLVCLGAVPSVFWLVQMELQGPPPPERHDPRYATQTGSITATRKAQLREAGSEDSDAALETCAGLGVDRLAASYGIPPDKRAVARRFSLSVEPAVRAHWFHGCLAGFNDGGG